MILILLFCPAVTRVLRVQVLGQSTSSTVSFQKSLNLPPEQEMFPADVSCVIVAVADAERPVAVRWLRLSVVFPKSLPSSRPYALRAPPISLV